VALRILSAPVFRLPGSVDRFVREARLAAMELHPTVVRVEDMGRTDDGVPFLVMELLRGETLAKVLRRRGPLSLDESLAIARPVLEGLAAAHNKGIIHRDIKPANIFLVDAGTAGPPVRILDMGIAKNLDDPERITHTGQVVGTPKYLAPEVTLEQSRDRWRPAVDVFSVGMLLHKMLTGRLPLDREDRLGPRGTDALRLVRQMETYERLLSAGEDLPGPAAAGAQVPAPVDRLVRRATATEWTRRYADAKEMLLAFDEVAAKVGWRPTPATVTALLDTSRESGPAGHVDVESGRHVAQAAAEPTLGSSWTPTLTPITTITAELVARAPRERASSFELALVVEDGLGSADAFGCPAIAVERRAGGPPPHPAPAAVRRSPEPPRPIAPFVASLLSPAPPELSPTPLPPLSDPPQDRGRVPDADATVKMSGPPDMELDPDATLRLDRPAVLPRGEPWTVGSRHVAEGVVATAFVALGIALGLALLRAFAG
jgi:serine/threonine protein kinase